MREGWFRRRWVWYFRRKEVLDAHKRREGGCARCGRCCRHCPFHDEKRGACRIYRMRPDVCRMFPLTPEDVKDIPTCGFRFKD
jgi:hypothetical protein